MAETEDCSISTSTSHNEQDTIQEPDSAPLSRSRDDEYRHHHHAAAVRLQKVYKSFRTRRQLADCAVLAEQRWWKVLDFAELKRSSISFFDVHHPETAVSRWSRARTKAAKVGKGLSKDAKARKLALQHWLEAIDPRHRYGHNLQFYYLKWLHCESTQPFFFWLDIGGGREVSFERCPRTKLLQQCIKYLGPVERLAYEVVIKEAKFVHKETGNLIDTTKGPSDAKWIFVLSTSKTLYVGKKNKGTFQHSSFLAGGATLSAGRLIVEEGVLKAIWPHSGHYLPTEENFQEFISFLTNHDVDLIDVKVIKTHNSSHFRILRVFVCNCRSNISEFEFHKSPSEEEETANTSNEQEKSATKTEASENADENREYRPKLSNRIGWKMSKLAIPNKEDIVYDIFKSELQQLNPPQPEEESPDEEGYETAEDSFLTEEDFIVPKITSLDEEEEEEKAVQEKIMVRINSHKGMNTYQLANQLSCKWTTGAGPRIGCMRDYPIEIQFRVLEHAQLSPRGRSKTYLRPLGPRFGGLAKTPTGSSVVLRPVLHRRAETAVPTRIPVELDEIDETSEY
ncbi:IQ domain-containing protein IQM6 [Linum perenne]